MAACMRPMCLRAIFRSFTTISTVNNHILVHRLCSTVRPRSNLVKNVQQQYRNKCWTRLESICAGPIGPGLLSRCSSSSASSGDTTTKTGDGANKQAPPISPEEEERVRAANVRVRSTKYALIGLAVLISGTCGYLLAIWGSPKVDEDGNIQEDEFSNMSFLKQRILRTWKDMTYYKEMIKEPSREKLLPDPLTDPYFQPPYTLVLEMTGILVHPEWTYKTGWRFKKRPGIDFFLQHAGPPLFEIVVYTSEPGMTAHPLVDSLDPNGYISYRLYRDTTRYEDGHHVKDLSGLNRDLSRVIVIDWNEKSIKLQPENALKLKKWTGADNDSTLFDLAIFLRTIVASEIEDVRPVLQFFSQFEDPLLEFKENQRRLQEEQEQLRLAAAEKPPNLVGNFSLSLLGRKK